MLEIFEADLMNLTTQEQAYFEDILSHSSDATVFHTPEWNQILMAEFPLNNKTLIAIMGDVPVGMYSFYTFNKFGLRWCQSPPSSFETHYGGPITIDNNPQVYRALLTKSHEVAKAAQYRLAVPPNYPTSTLEGVGYRVMLRQTGIVDLQKGEELLWNDLKQETRTRTRKAIKSGVTIRERDVSSVDEYSKMIESTFARVGHTNILPKSFYQRVMKTLQPKNIAKMLLAEYGNKLIAGAIFLCFKDTVYYWHGASYKEFWKVAPNNLIHWEIIKWASDNGYKFYDLMVVEPERLPGVAHFKMSWGAEIINFYSAVRESKLLRWQRKLRGAITSRRDKHPKLVEVQ